MFTDVVKNIIRKVVKTGMDQIPDSTALLLAGGVPDKKDGQTLHPKQQLLLKLLEYSGLPAPNRLLVSGTRMLDFFTQFFQVEAPEMFSIKNIKAEWKTLDIKLRVYVPEDFKEPVPILVYYHGGGWVQGDLDSHDPLCRSLAKEGRFIVISVDYRRAPENKFPSGVDDAYAAYSWIRSHAAELGGDPHKLAVGGDSSGGNLAAVVTLLARKDHDAPGFQLLYYPGVDLSPDTPSYHTFGQGYYLTKDLIDWYKDNYLNSPEDLKDIRVSPALVEDFKDLPPAMIITAGFDPLRDDAHDYAKSLEKAGVPVKYVCYENMIHGFLTLTAFFEEGREAIRDSVAEMNRVLR